MQLIQLPTNPRNLLRKINLIAQDLARPRRRPQRIQRAAHHARRGLLIVEDPEYGGADGDDEDGEGLEPAFGRVEGGQFAVCAAFQERACVWAGRWD